MGVRSWLLAGVGALSCLASGVADAAETNTGRAPSPVVQPQAKPRPTAKELYIGCYLLARDTDVPLGPDGHFANYSAANCGEQVLSTMTFREGAKPGGQFRFCLPDTPATREEPAVVMAKAYLDFYERKGARLPKDTDGSGAFIVAMVETWPCPGAPKPPTR